MGTPSYGWPIFYVRFPPYSELYRAVPSDPFLHILGWLWRPPSSSEVLLLRCTQSCRDITPQQSSSEEGPCDSVHPVNGIASQCLIEFAASTAETVTEDENVDAEQIEFGLR
jgi:hypothetical protein